MGAKSGSSVYRHYLAFRLPTSGALDKSLILTIIILPLQGNPCENQEQSRYRDGIARVGKPVRGQSIA